MKSLLKIMLAVLLATWIVPAIMAADGNFTGYPDGQYIWIANPELRIRDQGQIGWGDGTRTAPDATFSYDSVTGRVSLIGATFMAQSGQVSASGNTGLTENVANGSAGTFVIEGGLIVNYTTPSPTPSPTPTAAPTATAVPPTPTPSP